MCLRELAIRGVVLGRDAFSPAVVRSRQWVVGRELSLRRRLSCGGQDLPDVLGQYVEVVPGVGVDERS